MDMTLRAPKMLIAELQAAVHDGDFAMLGQMKFQRVWLQGVVVSPLEHGTMVLDDGSGVIDLFLKKDHQALSWHPGMYILVTGIGGCCVRSQNICKDLVKIFDFIIAYILLTMSNLFPILRTMNGH
ncbi:hypothetical protein Mapa_016796 [Marchantia paleacea]|nr:hypothetical protein Mapa_016796 [Marchantia paleacea]